MSYLGSESSTKTCSSSERKSMSFHLQGEQHQAHPLVGCGTEFWSLLMKNLVKLEKAQEKATKIIKEVEKLLYPVRWKLWDILRAFNRSPKNEGYPPFIQNYKIRFPRWLWWLSHLFFLLCLFSFFPQKSGVHSEFKRHTGACWKMPGLNYRRLNWKSKIHPVVGDSSVKEVCQELCTGPVWQWIYTVW